MFERKKCLLQTDPVVFRRQIDALYGGIGSYQFSLRELLLAVTIAAGACGIMRHICIPDTALEAVHISQTQSLIMKKIELLLSGKAR